MVAIACRIHPETYRTWPVKLQNADNSRKTKIGSCQTKRNPRRKKEKSDILRGFFIADPILALYKIGIQGFETVSNAASQLKACLPVLVLPQLDIERSERLGGLRKQIQNYRGLRKASQPVKRIHRLKKIIRGKGIA